MHTVIKCKGAACLKVRNNPGLVMHANPGAMVILHVVSDNYTTGIIIIIIIKREIKGINTESPFSANISFVSHLIFHLC